MKHPSGLQVDFATEMDLQLYDPLGWYRDQKVPALDWTYNYTSTTPFVPLWIEPQSPPSYFIPQFNAIPYALPPLALGPYHGEPADAWESILPHLEVPVVTGREEELPATKVRSRLDSL